MAASASDAVSAELWPWVLYAGMVIVVVAGMVGASALLGPRHRGRTTGLPYESGMPASPARGLVRVRYWPIAIVFVVFDVGIAFLIAWSVAVRELGWAGYAGVCAFAAVLGLALAYVWRQGVLDWAA